MRWNDIKKRFTTADTKSFTPVVDPVASPTPEMHHKKYTAYQWIFVVAVAVIVILGIIVLVLVFKKQKNTTVLPVEDLKTISTFLDENPPQPVTNDQAKTINNTINKPVELNDEDMQSINNFLKS